MNFNDIPVIDNYSPPLGMGGFFYVATPYSDYGDLDEAARQASLATAWIMMRGFSAISPIVHGHAVAKEAGLDPLAHEFWMRVSLPLLRASHGLIVVRLLGWDLSDGIRQEITYSVQNNKPIYTTEYNENAL